MKGNLVAAGGALAAAIAVISLAGPALADSGDTDSAATQAAGCHLSLADTTYSFRSDASGVQASRSNTNACVNFDSQTTDSQTTDSQTTDSQASDSQASDGLASDGLASDGLASDGLASDGLASDGLASDGLASDGLASDGLASNGLASNGPASNGLAADGLTRQDGQAADSLTAQESQAPADFVGQDSVSSYRGPQPIDYRIGWGMGGYGLRGTWLNPVQSG
ncbi:hypothetical protein ACTMTI_34955 [Nonomuraea sp. H19]